MKKGGDQDYPRGDGRRGGSGPGGRSASEIFGVQIRREAEEEELESLGGEDSGPDTSPCGMSGPVTPQVSVHLNTYHCTLFNLKRKIGGFNSKRRGQIKVKVYKRN